MIYSDEQERIITKAVNHVLYKSDGQVYQFAGKAGTGKTQTIIEIIKRIGIPLNRVAIMTYIGQAAVVLRSRGLYNAKTICSTLYEFVEQIIVDQYGNPIIDTTYNKPMVELVFRPKELYDIDYFIIDEGRTVPMSMKKEIESRNKPIIVCGDWRQLPPVKDEPAYLRDEDIGKIDILTKPFRQDKTNKILELADLVYEGHTPNYGYYGDVVVIDRDDLNNNIIKSANIIICGYNKTRQDINDRTRNEILNVHSKLPGYGEKLICRKNNWGIEIEGISLANGLIGSVLREPTMDAIDDKSFMIDFKPDLLNTYFHELKCDKEYFLGDMSQKQLLKNNKYNDGCKFEFAYSITTHLSQGAQYPVGVYMQEYFSDKNLQRCLNYTGVTRFKNMLVYILPPKRKYY